MTISMAVDVGSRAREIYSRFADYECEAAIRHYEKEFKVSHEDAQDIFAECLKFLAIKIAQPTENPAPSDALDEMWHSFIIQTREYDSFCWTYADRFLHHRTTAAPRSDAYENTLAVYGAAFGLEHPVWVTPRRAGVPDIALGEGVACQPCRIAGWCSDPH